MIGLDVGSVWGGKDRCNLMVNPQGSAVSRWEEEEGRNGQRGITAPHLLFFCTPCPRQSASTTTPTADTDTPTTGLCCVSKKKKKKKSVLLQQSPGTCSPHIKAASFSLNVNIKSVDHKSQHSLHKLPLPQPLILPSDEGERGRGVSARGSDGGREGRRERW